MKPASERLAYDIRARLSRSQWGVLALVAEQHQIGLSGALRHIIDSWAMSFRDEQGRTLLEAAAGATSDPEAIAALRELAERQAADEDES